MSRFGTGRGCHRAYTYHRSKPCRSASDLASGWTVTGFTRLAAVATPLKSDARFGGKPWHTYALPQYFTRPQPSPARNCFLAKTHSIYQNVPHRPLSTRH